MFFSARFFLKTRIRFSLGAILVLEKNVRNTDRQTHTFRLETLCLRLQSISLFINFLEKKPHNNNNNLFGRQKKTLLDKVPR